MKNSIKLLAILFIFCLSCTTDSNNDDVNDPTDPTPNTTALLKRTVLQDDSGNDYVINYIYNGNKLIGFNESDTFNATYTYANELLVRKDAYIGNIQETYTILEYDANNVLTQYTVYFVLGGTNSATRHVITYLPNNEVSVKSYSGDHTTQDIYTSEEINTFINGNWTRSYSVDYADEEVFTYDTKNGALKNIHQAAIFQLLGEIGEGSTNNPMTFGTGERRLEYTYNTNDYPVSSLGYEDGNSTPVESTQYFYD